MCGPDKKQINQIKIKCKKKRKKREGTLEHHYEKAGELKSYMYVGSYRVFTVQS